MSGDDGDDSIEPGKCGACVNSSDVLIHAQTRSNRGGATGG